MLDLSSINELDEIIGAAAIDKNQWVIFSRKIRELLPEIKVFMHVTDASTQEMQPSFSDGIADDFLNEYVSYYDKINPWTKINIRYPFMKPMWTEDHIPAVSLRGSEFYEDFLRRLGDCDSASGIKLLHDEHRFAQLSFHYSSRRAKVCNATLAPMLKLLAPTMRRSLQALKISQAAVELDNLGGFVQRLLHPAVVLDRYGRVRASNPSMDDLLNAKGIKIGREGKLSIPDERVQSALLATVESYGRSSMTQPLKVFPLPILKTRCGDFQISCSPMSGNMSSLWGVGEQWAKEPVLLLTFAPLCSDPIAKVDLIRQLFALTPAEGALCNLLAEGASLAEAADRQKITYETSRSHLRSIFNKLGVKRQTELITLIQRAFPGMF